MDEYIEQHKALFGNLAIKRIKNITHMGCDGRRFVVGYEAIGFDDKPIPFKSKDKPTFEVEIFEDE